MGMRNHEYVSAELITRIGNLRGGETFKTIQKLLKNKLITHIGNKCRSLFIQVMDINLPILDMTILLLIPF